VFSCGMVFMLLLLQILVVHVLRFYTFRDAMPNLINEY
jgi:hypothetical protein